MNIKSLTVSFYADVVLVGKGGAEVEMTFQGVGTPFDTTQEQHYTELGLLCRGVVEHLGKFHAAVARRARSA